MYKIIFSVIGYGILYQLLFGRRAKDEPILKNGAVGIDGDLSSRKSNSRSESGRDGSIKEGENDHTEPDISGKFVSISSGIRDDFFS